MYLYIAVLPKVWFLDQQHGNMLEMHTLSPILDLLNQQSVL